MHGCGHWQLGDGRKLAVAKACGSVEAIDKGKEIHGDIADMALVDNDMMVLGNASMDMYAKCDMFGTAKEVLEKFVFQDVNSLECTHYNICPTGTTPQSTRFI